MFCCPNCFTHKFLKNYIDKESSETGKCAFCNNKKKTAVFEAELLIDLFQPIFDLYSENKNGQYLNAIFQEDWNIFSNNIDDKNQIYLLSDMSKLKGLNSKRFIPIYSSNSGFKDKWDDFAIELKNENRFFPKKTIDTNQLSELFSYLIMPEDEKPEFIYRARTNHDVRKISIKEMGKPPIEKSTDGRANPKGISYFYGASDAKTAIAE